MTLPYSRALVTGATGFIGRQLVRALRESAIDVHTLSIKEEGQEGVTAHQGDLTDPMSVSRVVKTVRPDVIFHLAAYGTFGHEQDVPRMIAVNIAGTYHLLSAATMHGCKRFIFTASAKEYATSRIPITEEAPLAPWDDYAVTKVAATFFCKLAAEKQGFLVSVLRLSPVYGPGDSSSRYVLTAIRAALEGVPFTISVGSLVRNFTYIDDVVEAMLLASARAGSQYEEFNVGASKAYSFEDILIVIERTTGKRISRMVAPYSGKEDDSWVLDSSKANRLLKWEARVSLDEGIRRTFEWYRQTL